VHTVATTPHPPDDVAAACDGGGGAEAGGAAPQGGDAVDCTSGPRGGARTMPHHSLGRCLIELRAELGQLRGRGDDSGRSRRGCLACDSTASGVGVGARCATRQRAGEVEDEGVDGVAVDEGFRQGMDTGVRI
jgi:hypothetical protein